MSFETSGIFYEKVNINEYNSKGLSGLSNLGNTCYANSAIQCLSNTLSLTNYFLKEKYIEDLDDDKVEHHLVKEWVRLLDGIWSSNCTIAPHSFLHIVNILALKNGMIFGNGTQQDLQEFLQFFIDSMHNALSQEVTITISGNAKNNSDKMALESMQRWKDYFKNDYSILVELFYGQLCSKIVCPDCKHLSNTYDPFCYLSVPLPCINREEITIYDCLDKFTELETLDSDNQWQCESCKKKQNALKKDIFWKLPKILIVHLKRFNNNINLNKNSKKVNYPIKNLDMTKYSVGYEKIDLQYNLYAIGCHEGNLNAGHYYSYCLNSDKKWYRYDDSSVSLLDPNFLITESAYCLFYVR